MEEVLEQATIFIDDTLPATFKKGGLKKSPPSIAKVEVLKRNISIAEIQAIPWINDSTWAKVPHSSYLSWYWSLHSKRLTSMQVFRGIGPAGKSPPKHGLPGEVAMLIIVPKGPQTSTSSIAAYDMNIRSMSRRDSPIVPYS